MPKPRARRAPSAALLATLLGALLAAPPAALAGRPLDTDDAAVIPRGTCQLESYARRVGAGDDRPVTGDYGVAPSCNPFGWGEVLIGGGRAGVGTPSSTVSQAVVQLKRVPVAMTHDNAGWGYSASFEEDFVKGQGRPAARLTSVNALTSVLVADAVQVDANVGWIHAWAPAQSDRNHAFLGLSIEWTLTPRLTLVAERTAVPRLGHATQVGLTWVVSPRVTVDAAFGVRRGSDSRATIATVGLTMVTRAP